MSLLKQLLGKEYQEAPSANPVGLADILNKINEIQKSMIHAIDRFQAPTGESPAHHHFVQFALNQAQLQRQLHGLKEAFYQTFDILNYCTAAKAVSMDPCTQQALTDIFTHQSSFKHQVEHLTLPSPTRQSIHELMAKIEKHINDLHEAFECCASLTSSTQKKPFVSR